MAAADEQRTAAGAGGEAALRAAHAEVIQHPRLEGLSLHGDVAVQHQQGVFEVRAQRPGPGCAVRAPAGPGRRVRRSRARATWRPAPFPRTPMRGRRASRHAAPRPPARTSRRRRCAPGSAVHNCTPFKCPECRGGVCSVCEMPAPAVITLTPPGRSNDDVPKLSSCATSPSSSQVTVCRPMCGCGATSIGLASANVNGPKRSRKHQGPTRRRSLMGSAREIANVPRASSRFGYASSRGADAPSARHDSAKVDSGCSDIRAPPL